MGGFYTKGKHITDFGLTLISRDAPAPEDVSVVESVAWKNGVYDFSLMMGEPIKTNRPLTYYLMGKERNQVKKLLNKTHLSNWLLDGQIREIYDDGEPGYYYLGKCVRVTLVNDDGKGIVDYEIEFDCYPYRISTTPEGHDIWDEINFELDYFQNITATSEMGTFKDLAVGSYATIGAYATAFDGWASIGTQFIGKSRRILSRQSTTQGNSRWAYELEGINGLVLEQDIVQSRDNPTKITLMNPGMPSVVPTVITNNKISIVKGTQIFNFFPGRTKSELFRLESGKNELEITSIYPTNIEFEFYKELI